MTEFRDDTDASLPPMDPELGAALRALPLPDHAEGFFAALQNRLDQEHTAMTTSTLRPAPVPPPHEPARRGRHWRRQTLRLAVVAAAAGVIGVAVGANLDGTAPARRETPPRVVAISAVEVAEKMHTALARVTTLRGEIVFRDADGEVRSRFVVTDAGDFRSTGMTRSEEIAYDATTGVERSYFVDPTGPDFGGERTGVSPGLPDGGPATWILRRELGSTVRALLDDPAGMTVESTTYDGRDAWVLELDVEPNKIGGGADHLAVTVDQESGYPVRVEETVAGAFFREVRLEKLAADTGDVQRSEFTLSFPDGVEVSRFDEGWRRLASLDEVRSEVGYAPLVPRGDALPEGFALQQISVADRAQGTGVEGLNPPTREAVSLSFHRGLDQILVTTRLRGAIVDGREPGTEPGKCTECLGDSSWSDPLASGEGFFDAPEPLAVSSGALVGAPGQLLIGPHTVPHVWVLGERLVVTVSGDATRSELVEILESLEPHTR
ncbi:MAG TPA: hypothetical protein VNA14_09930 [Mycobacteriales bacterium]|nr:hypothetical protein [Mycobacteriales bacterium]